MRFQESVLLLQDYYCSIEDSKPLQLPSPARVPLIEVQHRGHHLAHYNIISHTQLTSTEPQEPPSSATDLGTEQSLPHHTSNSSTKKK